MIDQPDILAQRFAALVNPLDDSDWLDVERRGRASRRPALVWRRKFALAAAVAIVALAASPLGGAVAGLGRDAFDGLSSWLRGEPGSPASASEQSGFESRNASSYASFPTGTKLRLLVRERAGGETFSLLGFRSGSSLCLRLIHSDRPEGRGANQCVTLRELRSSPAPALVAAEAHFRVGKPATAVDGVFGFADDTVETIALRRLRGGERSLRVAHNVFLALRGRPAGTVANHPPFDPIVQVHAVRRSGPRVGVPFIASDFGDYGSGIPTRPSYMGRGGAPASAVPGPKRVERRFRGGTIGWVERREPRGERWSPDLLAGRFGGRLLFSRAIQPDPDDPLRVGVSLFRSDRHARFGPRFEGVLLCSSELRPLTGNGSGLACLREKSSMYFPAGQPLTMSYAGPTQVTQVTGLAADGIARIELYLASGRIVPVPLQDNVFAVSAPSGQLPGRIVSYDTESRVVGMTVLGGAPKPRPCPPARLARQDATRRAPAPYERLDLGARTLNGSPIFGRSPAAIEAALGPPDIVRHPSSSSGHREPEFRYRPRGRNSADLVVRFGWRQRRLRAISFHYEGANVADAKLGQLLRRQPEEIQRRLASVYGSRYDLELRYGSEPRRGCMAEFTSANKRIRLSFGVNPYRGGLPSLTFSHGY